MVGYINNEVRQTWIRGYWLLDQQIVGEKETGEASGRVVRGGVGV